MSKKRLTSIIIITLALVLLVGGVVLADRWTKPMAATISNPTRTPLSPTTEPSLPPATEAPSNSATATGISATQAPPIATSLPRMTATPSPLCGAKTAVQYYLAMGIGDEDPKYLYGVADVVRVIRVDWVTPRVTVMTLPRDLFVKFNDLRDAQGNLLTQGKLNQAYFFGSPGMGYFKGEGEGAGLMAKTILENFDLYIDHYGALNMQIFTDLINAMGGVDIYLPEFVDGRPIGEESYALDKSQGFFPKGWNHMNGKDALSFVRIRARYGETQRTEHQTMLICAVKEQLTGGNLVRSIPKLVGSFIENTRTDLSIGQISQLACLLPKLKSENLVFYHIPFKNADNPEGILESGLENIAHMPGESFVYTYDSAILKAFLDKFENDTLVPEPATGTSTCPEHPPLP